MSCKSTSHDVDLYLIIGLGGVVFLITLILGILLGCSCKKCCKYWQKQKLDICKPPAIYEDVTITIREPEMTCNEAYGVHTASY